MIPSMTLINATLKNRDLIPNLNLLSMELSARSVKECCMILNIVDMFTCLIPLSMIITGSSIAGICVCVPVIPLKSIPVMDYFVSTHVWIIKIACH